jgi:alpha 1,2-mannosyltransferase
LSFLDESSIPPVLGRRANATLLMLARNSDLDQAVRSVRRMEDRFNRRFRYPWTFLNDEDFNENFKLRIAALTSSETTFGVVPSEQWVQPSWINEHRATYERQLMINDHVIYGGSVSYRNMCRFNSGVCNRVLRALEPRLIAAAVLFQASASTTLPMVLARRVCENQFVLVQTEINTITRPDVHYHCDIDFDPFLFMQDSNKTYGFTIALHEYQRTIETLWPTVKGTF